MTWVFPLRNWLGEVPTGAHPGAFGVKRRFHTHEGVDLYCEQDTPVFPVETGIVVAIKQFTGPEVGSPHWLPTHAIFIRGATGVVVYGEIKVADNLAAGSRVQPEDEIGTVTRVLRNDKGKPTTMLHLELRENNVELFDWLDGVSRPDWLLDPTPYLVGATKP